ncbi:hypothetical protein [Caballeronia telluris]|uniref:Uncharacterized protein n=1 Tax=Caballeronia telluris TaxID=326475 RepID=A0A158G514_9BURK|nr:hypothetical protein [Caballeronia telluris]SAL27122.1 hypothetical protein AWB66_01601 [Caballeronia telluris]
MKSLMIKDLAVTEELDSRAMSAVRGGNAFYLPGYDFSKLDVSVNTQQGIGQTQNVFNQNGNNVAFATDIDSKVKPIQKADNTNTVNIYGGGLVA